MPDDGIMLTLSTEEWAWIWAALRTARRELGDFPAARSRLTALIDKLADRLNLDLEKLDG